VSGSGDDERAPRRGAVPPPGLAPGEAPESLHIQRLEPPPSSLEAMVQSQGRRPKEEGKTSWLVWVVGLLLAAAVTAYVMR
jgi:hypothetical protein